jgi:hypothetical protein
MTNAEIKRVADHEYVLFNDVGVEIERYSQTTMEHPTDWLADARAVVDMCGPYDWEYVDDRDQ